MQSGTSIAHNLELVRRRLRAAAERANRSPSDITLVAVSKTFSTDAIRAAVAAGQHRFGENRVQEGLPKIDQLAGQPVEWHLIGHLQSNKVKKAAASFAWIESIDSVELVTKIDRAAAEAGRRPCVLIQVDLAREATKFGVPEDRLDEVVSAAIAATSIDLRGFMIVPPYADDPEASRPWFRRLREIRDEFVARGRPADKLAGLSMGMSHDFEVAIEEGATIVRVGSAIFGERPPAPLTNASPD